MVAGDPLMDGPIDPHDILKVKGADELQRYLVDEIQEVCRLPGVAINDKHIEVIGRQRMRWVKIENERQRLCSGAAREAMCSETIAASLSGVRFNAGLLERGTA